ncbi:MAG: 16S rRNA (cytosine(1402)-N(4))-methyltransferase RsmH [Phycisphaerales bacterium]|nr:16S rRNA (cytosine(1402)-N(4))-methyltransferase RsmH [Phycisphaerales bacterium]
MMEGSEGHTPVLIEEVCKLLDVHSGEVVLDATVGMGGHALRLGQMCGTGGRLIGLDRDPDALRVAGERLAGLACRVELRQADFRDAQGILAELGVEQVNVVLADLGVNSAQLADAERGFSFREDGPLDMRLDPTAKTTAADLVNRLSEKELGDVIYFNAQEPASRRIARRIYEARRSGRVLTTGRLAHLVCEALGVNPDSRRSKIHPATRTFLALRMAVNDEMGSLDRLLQALPGMLAPGARVGLISFHSTEDRRIKRDFLKRRSEGLYRVVTKKPVVASDDERRSNPRSRSAKLRVALREPAEGKLPGGVEDVEDAEDRDALDELD